MAGIDLQQIAAGLYQMIKNLNQSAMQIVGIDAIWCRLLPYENAEDVVIQEYTLHNYECPKNIKVATSNSNYNVGNFSIDLFGIKSSEQLEINIDIETWKSIYGNDAMPQKGDFVLIPIMHKAYEVMTSTAVHSIGELLTSWKCILGEWKHAASRKESEDFKISIDDLTVSQDRLFGEQISKEVADTVVEAETAYNTTTNVDPYKDFDIDSIVIEDVYGANGNAITDAYYDFSVASKNINYKMSAIYDSTVIENHWIYSCWFRKNEAEIESGKLKINKLYLKEKDYWYFDIESGVEIEEGDDVIIYRGNAIKLNGTIEAKDCDSGFVVRILSSDCYKASKKIQNWWTTGIWRIDKSKFYNLITMENSDDNILKIDISDNNIITYISETKTYVNIFENFKKISYDEWYYIAFDITPDNMRVVIQKRVVSNGKITNKAVIDKNVAINLNGKYEFDQICIDNKGSNFNICKIRLYESEYPLEDNYKLDMSSQITNNASKLILVDNPSPANKMTFITPIK